MSTNVKPDIFVSKQCVLSSQREQLNREMSVRVRFNDPLIRTTQFFSPPQFLYTDNQHNLLCHCFSTFYCSGTPCSNFDCSRNPCLLGWGP